MNEDQTNNFYGKAFLWVGVVMLAATLYGIYFGAGPIGE